MNNPVRILAVMMTLCFVACSGGFTKESESSAPSNEGGGRGGGAPGGGGGSGETPISELSEITTSYSLSTDRIHLSAGETQTISFSLGTPSTKATNISYRLFGPQADLFPSILSEAGGQIHVPAGATSFSFDLSFPSLPSFAGQGNLQIVFDRNNVAESSFLINLHTDNIRDFDQISAGYGHSCGIRSGALYCWGEDRVGQLGNGAGTPPHIAVPTRIGASSTWSQISAGHYHTCGINNGELYCWGLDYYGQVGNGSGSNTDVLAPQRIGVSSSWTQVYASHDHSCGIDAGRLYCWGRNIFGQVGDGTTNTVHAPKQIGVSTGWTSVSAGKNFSCGIDTGDLFCWGDDTYGQLGNGPASTTNRTSPQRVGASSNWTQISLGYSFACGLNSGELYCWGSDSRGTLGNGDANTANMDAPEKIGTENTWSDLNAGYYHSCAITAGQLYCWGNDELGAVGNGLASIADVTAPQRIGTSTSWTQISAGSGLTCGLNAGKFICWGRNDYGQLGSGAQVSDSLAYIQKLGDEASWGQLAAGSSHSCGINSGSLYCWGSNYSGQVGNGTTSARETGLPEKIGSSTSWTMVSAGQSHSCGINSGELFCWGDDSYGQLGNGAVNSTNVYAPEKIGASNTWSQISLGSLHSCGIDAGRLYCWGRDQRGQVGNGGASSTDVTQPEQIGASNTWSFVAAGDYHTCGINSGELFCWGEDSAGQVGNGLASAADVSSPEKIGVSAGWTLVAAGYDHSCGIDSGELFCWGADSYGQVGNGSGSSADVTSPERIGLSSTWTHIDTGQEFSCGIDGGELYCWGSDYYNNLGNGEASAEDVTAPEKIGSIDTWSSITCGDLHILALEKGRLHGAGQDPFKLLHHSPGTF